MCKSVKTLKISQGRVTIIDEEDFDKISKYKWFYNIKTKGTSQKPKGYVQRSTHIKLGYKKYKSKTIYLHREILNTDLEVDHINGDSLDNRKENLRVSSRVQQCQNTSSRINSTSKYVGVHFHKLTKKWRAQIKFNGKTKSLGLFFTEEEAAKARATYIENNNLNRFKKDFNEQKGMPPLEVDKTNEV